ncbi:hypothetical protein VPH35_006425 [Triticum aestivum]
MIQSIGCFSTVIDLAEKMLFSHHCFNPMFSFHAISFTALLIFVGNVERSYKLNQCGLTCSAGTVKFVDILFYSAVTLFSFHFFFINVMESVIIVISFPSERNCLSALGFNFKAISVQSATTYRLLHLDGFATLCTVCFNTSGTILLSAAIFPFVQLLPLPAKLIFCR